MEQIKQRPSPRLTESTSGKGRVGFLWRRNLDKNIIVLEELGNDRIIILKVNLSLHNTMFIVAVYLPTSKESINILKAYLGTLDEILCSLEHDGTVMVVGDFNAHIGNLGRPRCLNKINGQGTYLYERLEKYYFVSINSQSFCQGPISYSGSYCREGLQLQLVVPSSNFLHC